MHYANNAAIGSSKSSGLRERVLIGKPHTFFADREAPDKFVLRQSNLSKSE